MTAILLAGAMPAAASSGDLTVGAVDYDEPATQTGGLAILFASDLALDEQGRPAAGARPWIDLTATAIAAVEFEDHYYEFASGSASVRDMTKDPTATGLDFASARAHLSDYQPGFEVHVYRLDGTIAYTLESGGGRFAAAETARMGPGGFGGDAIQGTPAAEEPRTFGLVERPGPWVQHYLTEPKLSAVLRGDFIVELSGITLAVESAGGDGLLRSGKWRDPVDPNVPPQASTAAAAMTERFVRLHLTGAVLEFATEGGSPDLLWAASDVAADFTGPATLVDARGTLGQAQLSHERHQLEAGNRVHFTPTADNALGLDIGPSPLEPSGGTLASVPSPASAALIGTGAILALAIAVGIGFVRRLLRLPALADVEKALEEGEYRKAARLAGRILARLPGSEEALLARAIALSKSGHHEDVVAEVTRHLALRPASDGSLHYVLGLAQIDAGRPGEGQASLREAVRLTPSLQAEVAPRLGKAFSVAQPTTRETHGYA